MSDFRQLNTTIPREKLEASVIGAVASALDLQPEEIELSASMQDDLGAESLDYLDIAFQLERKYRVQFPREDLLERIGEHFGEGELVEGGTVSERGLELMRTAMPEIDPARLRPGIRAYDIAGLFTVQTFVRVFDRLLAAKEQMSRECAECGGELEDSNTLPELVCSRCKQTVPLSSGDEVLFQDLLDLLDGKELSG